MKVKGEKSEDGAERRVTRRVDNTEWKQLATGEREGEDERYKGERESRRRKIQEDR